MNFEKEIRIHELSVVTDYLPRHGTMLEVGAGAGWQSEVLAQLGYRVVALDVATSRYRSIQSIPVFLYDGSRMPFRPHSFDCFYSSNVLEHVRDLETFQQEALRVTKPDGVAVHLMPTAAWRFWTILTHYVFILRKVCSFALLRLRGRPGAEERSDSLLGNNRGNKISRALLPERHGEEGNLITEIYYFSRFRWRRRLSGAGWQVVEIIPTRLFYTGHLVFGYRVPLRIRNLLSYLLGSSCLVYILRPDQAKSSL